MWKSCRIRDRSHRTGGAGGRPPLQWHVPARTQYQVVVRPGVPMGWTGDDQRIPPHVADARRAKSVIFARWALPAAGGPSRRCGQTRTGRICLPDWTVPKRNIVQLLAREENSYGRFYGGGETLRTPRTRRRANLSSVAREGVAQPGATTALDIRGDDGTARTGYLVSARTRMVDSCLETWSVSRTLDSPCAGWRHRLRVGDFADAGINPDCRLRVLVYG